MRKALPKPLQQMSKICRTRKMPIYFKMVPKLNILMSSFLSCFVLVVVVLFSLSSDIHQADRAFFLNIKKKSIFYRIPHFKICILKIIKLPIQKRLH